MWKQNRPAIASQSSCPLRPGFKFFALISGVRILRISFASLEPNEASLKMFKTPFIVTEPRFGRSNYVGGSNAVAARLNFRGLMARIPMTRAFEPTRPLAGAVCLSQFSEDGPEGNWPAALALEFIKPKTVVRRRSAGGSVRTCASKASASA